MPLNFPNAPTTGQVFPASHQTGVPTWIWDGSEWTIPPLIPKVVTVNATGAKLWQGTAVTSLSYTGLTVATGTHSAIVVTLGWDAPATTPTAMSMIWDSGGTNQAMTRIITSDTGAHTGAQSELWGLVNPTVGNKTLALSWTSAARVFVSSMAFDGVDQTGGATSFPNSVFNAGAATLNVTSIVGRKVMCCAVSNSAPGAITGTTIFYDGVSGTVVYAYANYDNGAPSVTIGSASGNGPIVATDILAG
jgi:hypothetical protein